MMIMTNKVAVKMTEEVIKEHAPRILAELGMTENNDGILDRIAVSTETGENTPYGNFNHVTLTRGFMGSGGVEYKVGSGNVTIYPVQFFNYVNKKGEIKHAWFARVGLLKGALRRKLIETLAHELRHYWQYYTGEAFKHDSIGGRNFMPYEWRWVEKDARKFASEYLKSIK